MDSILLNTTSYDFEWQATFPSLVSNLKDKILLISNATARTDKLPKTLTAEASWLICILLCFVVFSLAGGSITAFEYFCDKNTKKKESRVVKHAKKTTIGEEEAKGRDFSVSDGVLKKIKRFFKCFCFVTNGAKILVRTASRENEMNCVHGIRVINSFWTIFTHTSMIYIQTTKNLEDQGPFLRSWFLKAVMKGDYSNDACFTLGGFLNAFSFVQDYDKNGGNISWFRFYVKRIVRVAPLSIIVFSFYMTLFPYFDSGPLWPTYAIHPVCKKVWWWNLLFINNFQRAQNQGKFTPYYGYIYTPLKKMKYKAYKCMIWTWYLAADFQFYCVSPLFLLPLSRWPKLGYILAGVCICGSCASNFWNTKTYNLTMDLFRIGFHLTDIQGFIYKNFETFYYLVEKPHTRVGSYLVGILLGHYLGSTETSTTTKRNLEWTLGMSKCMDEFRHLFTWESRHFQLIHSELVYLYCGWILTALFMWISFFSLGNAEEPVLKFAVYNGVRHLLFACGTAWFIYICSTGQAEFINRCLSWHGFVVLSRLCYCAYLLNFLVLEYHFLRVTELGEEFSFPHMVNLSVCFCFWTFVAAFVVSAIIEIPVSRLYSMLSSKRKTD